MAASVSALVAPLMSGATHVPSGAVLEPAADAFWSQLLRGETVSLGPAESSRTLGGEELSTPSAGMDGGRGPPRLMELDAAHDPFVHAAPVVRSGS